MSTFEKWSLVLTGAGVSLALFTGVLILLQLRAVKMELEQSANIAALDHDRRRRQATLEFFTETMDKRVEWRKTFPNEFDASAVAAFAPDPANDGDRLNVEVAEYLGHYEDLAAGVALGIFDIDTVDRLAGPRLIRAFRAWQPWINGLRVHLDRPTSYIEWESLARDLVRRRFEEPVREGWVPAHEILEWAGCVRPIESEESPASSHDDRSQSTDG